MDENCRGLYGPRLTKSSLEPSRAIVGLTPRLSVTPLWKIGFSDESWMAGGLSTLWGISPVRRDVNPIRIKSTSFFTTDISTTTIPASYITVYSLQCGRYICTVPIARAVRTSSTSTFYILLVHMPYHTNKVCTKYVHFNILSTTDISTATM